MWLIAGALNVRADREIKWPEKQEIANLELNFIKLSKNVSQIKLAIISTAPMVAGLFFVWLIAHNVFDVTATLNRMRSGELDDIRAAIALLTATPDFWLWAYLLFVIGNTMMPDIHNLRGWRTVLYIAAAIGVGFVLLGVGNEVVLTFLLGPVSDALYLLASVFLVIIITDIVATAILGGIEALIERVTGHSATFVRGKLVAMTRQEMLEQRRRELARSRSSKKPDALPAGGPPSIYKLSLATPGPPGEVPVTQLAGQIIDTETRPPLPRPQDDRAGPDMITGQVKPTATSIPGLRVNAYTEDDDDADQDDEMNDDDDNEDEDGGDNELTYVDLDESM